VSSVIAERAHIEEQVHVSPPSFHQAVRVHNERLPVSNRSTARETNVKRRLQLHSCTVVQLGARRGRDAAACAASSGAELDLSFGAPDESNEASGNVPSACRLERCSRWGRRWRCTWVWIRERGRRARRMATVRLRRSRRRMASPRSRDQDVAHIAKIAVAADQREATSVHGRRE
jgi:hypothetical protein